MREKKKLYLAKTVHPITLIRDITIVSYLFTQSFALQLSAHNFLPASPNNMALYASY